MEKILIILPVILLLMACGGGGAGGGSENPPSPSPSVSHDNSQITLNVSGIKKESSSIRLTFDNLPDEGVSIFYDLDETDPSIESVDFIADQESSGLFQINFNHSVMLGKGTFNNQVTVLACIDDDCNNQIAGSPINIVTKVVSQGIAGITIDQEAPIVEANQVDSIIPKNIVIPIKSTFDGYIYYKVSRIESSHYHSYVETEVLDKSIYLSYRDPARMPADNYEYVYSISACYDNNCDYPLEGSPMVMPVSYEVSRFADDTIIIDTNDYIDLSHNIIDVEYSSTLNSIVIVSDIPRNSLYVYNMDNIDQVTEYPLDSQPIVVSIVNAGDSKKIAVGSASGIEYIDYDVDNPMLSDKKTISIPLQIGLRDIVATDGYVYELINRYQSPELRKVNVADGTIITSDISDTYVNSRFIKFHPNLNSIILSDQPERNVNLGLVNSSSLNVTDPFTSPYNDPFSYTNTQRCANIWLTKNAEIISACGNLFDVSESDGMSISHKGVLPLYSNSLILSVSENPLVTNEIALIEDNGLGVDLISIFDTDIGSRKKTYGYETNYTSSNNLEVGLRYIFYNKTGSSILAIANKDDGYIILKVNR